MHTVAKGLILPSFKFKSGNIVKSIKSNNLKEEELKAVARICSSKQVFLKISQISSEYTCLLAASEERIAEEVRNFPCLYDKGNRTTKKKKKKKKKRKNNAGLGLENACGYDEGT